MSDAETQPTTVSGAAQTIKGLLNPSSDKQPAQPDSETRAEEIPMKTQETVPQEIETNLDNIDERDASTDSVPEENSESTNQDVASEEPLFPVNINGEKYMVNQDELINGYQRQADYSRKTEELSIDRKQQEDNLNREKTEVQSRLTNLQQLEQGLQSQLDTEMQNIDFDKMYEEDPVQASRLQYQMQRRQKDLDQTRQQIAQQTSEQFNTYVSEQEKQMYIKMPEMKDPEKAQSVRRNMRTYLTDRGYLDQEIANLTDHRMLLILRDAMAYRTLQKSRPDLAKRVANAPKVIRAGVSKSKQEQIDGNRKKRIEKLKKTGSVREAAAIFRETLKIKS